MPGRRPRSGGTGDYLGRLPGSDRSPGLAMLLLCLVVASGCRRDEPLFESAELDTLPPFGEVAEGQLPPEITPEVARRQADDLDRHSLELRQHINVMRQISPRMAGTVMEEHAAHVRALAERVREQRVALPMPDERLPDLLGMTSDEYRVMLEEVQMAGREVSELLTAEEPAVREHLPGHLDRLERIAAQMEHAAASLRR